MIVVSDTTPLISLMKIGQLKLIYQLFGEIQIPEAVFEELVSNKRFLEESRQIQECSYIRKVKVTDFKSVDLLRRSTALKEEILPCVSILKNTGRHISDKLYDQLMHKLEM